MAEPRAPDATPGPTTGGATRGTPRTTAVALAPVARLLLNLQLGVLALLSLLADGTVVALVTLALMAVVALLPVLLWRRVGPVLLRHPAASAPLLLVAVAALLLPVLPPVLGVAHAVSVALLVGLLYGRVPGAWLATPLAAAALLTARGGAVEADAVLAVALVVAGVGGGRLREMLLELDAARLRAREHARALAVSQERARLAREMHDSVAKTLEGVALCTDAMRASDDPAQLRVLADRVADGVGRARTEARAVLSGLRGDDVDVPLADSLRELARTFAELNDLAVVVELDRRLPTASPEARHELFQVVREALHNVARHARASRVQVDVHVEGGADGQQLRLVVADDGVGDARPRAGHHGLRGMRERCEQLGGTLQVGPCPDGGTRVEVRVPLAAVHGSGQEAAR